MPYRNPDFKKFLDEEVQKFLDEHHLPATSENVGLFSAAMVAGASIEQLEMSTPDEHLDLLHEAVAHGEVLFRRSVEEC